MCFHFPRWGSRPGTDHRPKGLSKDIRVWQQRQMRITVKSGIQGWIMPAASQLASNLPLFLPPINPFSSTREGFLIVHTPCWLPPYSWLQPPFWLTPFKSQFRVIVILEALIDASHPLFRFALCVAKALSMLPFHGDYQFLKAGLWFVKDVFLTPNTHHSKGTEQLPLKLSFRHGKTGEQYPGVPGPPSRNHNDCPGWGRDPVVTGSSGSYSLENPCCPGSSKAKMEKGPAKRTLSGGLRNLAAHFLLAWVWGLGIAFCEKQSIIYFF